MITPLKGLFSIISKSPKQTSWLFTKRGEITPSITKDKSIRYVTIQTQCIKVNRVQNNNLRGRRVIGMWILRCTNQGRRFLLFFHF